MLRRSGRTVCRTSTRVFALWHFYHPEQLNEKLGTEQWIPMPWFGIKQGSKVRAMLEKVAFFIMKGHPFGMTASVFNFNRRAHALTWVLARLFLLMCFNFYDDHFGFCKNSLAEAECNLVKRICHLLGDGATGSTSLESLFPGPRSRTSGGGHLFLVHGPGIRHLRMVIAVYSDHDDRVTAIRHRSGADVGEDGGQTYHLIHRLGSRRGGICQGIPAKSDINDLAGYMWDLVAKRDIGLYVARVATDVNPSDGPSRADFSELECREAQWVTSQPSTLRLSANEWLKDLDRRVSRVAERNRIKKNIPMVTRTRSTGTTSEESRQWTCTGMNSTDQKYKRTNDTRSAVGPSGAGHRSSVMGEEQAAGRGPAGVECPLVLLRPWRTDWRRGKHTVHRSTGGARQGRDPRQGGRPASNACGPSASLARVTSAPEGGW